ncbi:UNVERIFIED_CONTAM: AUGMIN subunit [Sesamum radiatum]|uniref:AUGMIN subunit n=1 Tax=Sesamum radiatum TaxID=300843 RepID=A0AAW2W123_SESRA
MSGARLCGLLSELGYEGHGSLDPDSFEWPFQYDDVRPILDWLCSSLRPSNVLSPSELSQYEQFLQDGKLLEPLMEFLPQGSFLKVIRGTICYVCDRLSGISSEFKLTVWPNLVSERWQVGGGGWWGHG